MGVFTSTDTDVWLEFEPYLAKGAVSAVLLLFH